jgi:CheY-like chemotaxis protein
MSAVEALSPSVDVLIADDDPILRTGVRRLLERRGYRCTEAEEGHQALELVRRQKPQCVLLDLAMPDLDGLSVARLLRTDPRTHGVHINCLTGRVDRRAREQAHLAGCETFLTKPVDVTVLLDVVGSQVKRGPTEAVSGLNKAEAEALLDWLETWGCSALEAAVADETFTVRWAWPPDRSVSEDQIRKLISAMT